MLLEAAVGESARTDGLALALRRLLRRRHLAAVLIEEPGDRAVEALVERAAGVARAPARAGSTPPAPGGRPRPSSATCSPRRRGRRWCSRRAPRAACRRAPATSWPAPARASVRKPSTRATSFSIFWRFGSTSSSVPLNASGWVTSARSSASTKRALSGSAPWRTTGVDWFQRVRSDRTCSSRSPRRRCRCVPPPSAGASASSSATSCFAVGLLRLELDLVAPLVAIEERVAGGAEALPDRFRLVAAHRTDRSSSRSAGGGSPPAALSHSREAASSSARAHSASFCARLADQVSLRSARSALRRVKKRSHASRNRFQVARVSWRGTGPICCHSACSFFSSSAVLIQSVESASCLGARDERQLLLEVALALFVAVREELAQPRLDRIGGLTVAVPQRLRLGARRLGDLFQRSWMSWSSRAALSRSSSFGPPSARRSRYLARSASALRDQLLLHRGVGEALPLVHLAQVVQPRRDDGGGRLEPLEQRRAAVRWSTAGGASSGAAQIARRAGRPRAA